MEAVLQEAVNTFNLVPGVSKDSLLDYAKILNLMKRCNSPSLPSSFVSALVVIAGATVCQEEAKAAVKGIKLLRLLHDSARTTLLICQELVAMFGNEPQALVIESTVRIPVACLSDTGEGKVTQLEQALNLSQSPVMHLTNVKELIGVVCDELEKRLEAIVYRRKEGNNVAASVVDEEARGKLRALCDSVMEYKDVVSHLSHRLLRVCSAMGEWLCGNVFAADTNGSVMRDLIGCACLGISEGCKGIVEGVREVFPDAGGDELLSDVVRRWKECCAKCGSGGAGSIARQVLFPEREEKEYERGEGRACDDLATLANEVVAYKRCESIEDHFLLFRVSGDGTLATKTSVKGNSWYCFTLSLTNLPPINEKMGRDVYFLFIIPENAHSMLRYVADDSTASEYVTSFAKRITAKHVERVDLLLMQYASDRATRNDTVASIISATREMNQDEVEKAPSNQTRVECETTQKCRTGSNSYSRQLMRVVLKEARSVGDQGVLVSYGDKALHIRFAVLNAKGDLKACDEMADSAGLSSSNYPCRMCSVGKTRLDLNTGLSSVEMGHNLHRHREVMKGLHGAFAQQDMSCALRLTNHLQLLMSRNSGVDPVRLLASEWERITGRRFDDAAIATLERLARLLSHFPLSSAPYSPCCLYFYPEFRTYFENKHPTVCPYSNGLVQLADCLGFPMSRCICPDMMHLVPNALRDFLHLIFHRYGHRKDVDEDVLAAFERVGVNLEGRDGESLSWYIPERVVAGIQKFVEGVGFPDDHLVVKAVIQKEYDELKTHDSHVFVFCYLPVLLYPYQHYAGVRHVTSFIAVLQRIYNTRRLPCVTPFLHTQCSFHMNGLESASPPSAGNPSYHYCGHLGKAREVHGPLRPNDCFPEEASFFPLKQLILATSNSALSVFFKAVKRSAMQLVKEERVKAGITLSGYQYHGTILGVIKKIANEEVQVRTRFNFEADKDWLRNGQFNQRTLWDIEKCFGVDVVLEWARGDADLWSGGWSRERVMMCENTSGELRTVDDYSGVKSLFNKCGFSVMNKGQFGFQNCCKECVIDGTSFCTTCCLLQDLNVRKMIANPRAFAFVYDCDENLHLYALCAFFQARIGDVYYEQVWAYEVPHISLSLDSATQSCCFVDMDDKRMKKTPFLELLSVRRCVGNLRIVKYLTSIAAVISEKTGIKQLVHNIPFTMRGC